MSAFVEIRTQQAAQDIAARLKGLYHKDAAKAINRAINKTLGVANTATNKAIRSTYNIALSTLNDKDNKVISKSTETSLTGQIFANVKPLSLSVFNPTWTRDRIASGRSVLTNTKKGATRQVKRGSTGVKFQVLKGKTEQFKSAFMIFNKGGSPIMARGVYGNDSFNWGKSRLPISKLNTTSVFTTIFQKGIEKEIETIIADRYPQYLLHELEQGLKYNNGL
jgi:hypothetical protein